jgi:D-sedoheptulose 7-phosphate isomerase
MHIANDLISCGIKAQALTADIATLTAIANDFEYKSVFARQLECLADGGDLLIVLSGSGRSANVLAALDAAKRKGAATFAIVGEYNVDCPAANVADDCLKWGKDMQDAEEKQLYLGHKVMRWLKSS